MKTFSASAPQRAALVAALTALLVSGCEGQLLSVLGASNSMDDLKAYVAKIRARKGGKVEELPPIEPYVSYAYQSENAVDPFEPFFKEEPAPPPGPKPADNGIHPDPNRNKEELEAFPLDSLRMVGTLRNAKELWAIVRSPDGTIRRVRPGNYMGKNFGKITGIFEDHIELTEIVPDGQGGWVEREAQLALVEQ